MDDIIRYEQSFPNPLATSPLLPLLIISLAAQKNSPDTKSSIREEYDFIVVGAGTAGSVVASRLSEKKCVSVLVLEAGGRTPRLTDIPLTGTTYFGSNVTNFYSSEPQTHTAFGQKDRSIPLSTGRMIGGTSSLNAMVYKRGDATDYNDWARNGASGWSYEEVLPYFRKLEHDYTTSFDTRYHGYRGPIPLERPLYNSPVKSALREAAIDNGYPIVDPNKRNQAGYHDERSNMLYAQRYSTGKAYLVPAEKRRNLDIVAEAHVTKIILKNRRAVGVQVMFKGIEKTVMAKREVIVSAGALRSAQLLMLSGLGPRKHLEDNGIAVVHDLPVGRNLQDHSISQLVYPVDVPLGSFQDRALDRKNINQYILKRKGILVAPIGRIGTVFLNNEQFDASARPDNGLYFQEFPIPIFNTVGQNGSESYEEYIKRFVNKTLITCLVSPLRPKSRGYVNLKSNNPKDTLTIDFKYYEHPQDLKDAVEGLKHCIRLFSSPAMVKIGAKAPQPPFPGCERYESNLDDYLTCIAQSLAIPSGHFCGTNAMGRANDPTKVVDPKLRVRGIRGLRVIDGSIMPTVPSANTMFPIIMLAEKGSDLIKETITCRRRKHRKTINT